MAARKKAGAGRVEDEPALVDDVDTGPVQEHIGFRLRMAQVAVFRNFAEAFRPYDLRPVHYSALKLIGVARRRHPLPSAE